jgi:hypothetical protein
MKRKIIVTPGDVFGLLTVVKEVESASNGDRMIFCACSCGGNRIVRLKHLINGGVKSCGCLKTENKAGGRPIKDLLNQTFGSWKVLKFD